MMRKRFFSVLTIAALLCLFGLSFAGSATDEEITVAFFPYFPDSEFCQESLTAQWAALEPDVPLRFVSYNCYDDDDPGDADVLLYDAMCMTALVKNGYIRPIDLSSVAQSDGIFSSAVENAYCDGQLYGVPTFLCTNCLFYRQDDHALDEVQSIEQLYRVIGDRDTPSTKPTDEKDGLVLDLVGSAPFFYQDAIMDCTGMYVSGDPELLPPNEGAIDVLRMMDDMSGMYEMEDIDDSSVLIEWFREGYGRAYYGYTESLYGMEDMIDQLVLRPISFDESGNIQLFYMDVASLGATDQSPEKTALCMKLINLMTSEELMMAWCLGGDSPQYILPSRPAAYDRLAESLPVYHKLATIVENEPKYYSRFGTGIYDYGENIDQILFTLVNEERLGGVSEE